MKRYDGNDEDTKNQRKKSFLQHVQKLNADGKYDDEIKHELYNIDKGYFAFSSYDNFSEVIKDWFEDDEDLKQGVVSDVDNKLHKYGLSVNDTVYEVNWGTEPLYVYVLDGKRLVAIDTADEDEINVMFLEDLFSEEFDSEIEKLAAVLDVSAALVYMGVYPENN